jgi:hypothetical protein
MFSTKQGRWAYRKMPFGLRTAPAAFMRLMNTVLSGLTGIQYFVFLDIIICINSLAEHDAKLHTVFEKLRKYRLKLQPNKRKFLRKEVNYLGHVISENRVRWNPKKTESIENFPTPKIGKN